MMRKIFSLSIIAALLSLLLCGCGPSGASASTTEPQGESTGPVNVDIYYGNQTGDGFQTETVTLDKLDPGLIVDQLVSHGVMPNDCYLESCSLLHQKDGKVTLVLNFNNEFELDLRKVGASGEKIMMGSVVNTFLKAYHVDNVYVLAKKDVIKTDYNTYDDYLYFYS